MCLVSPRVFLRRMKISVIRIKRQIRGFSAIAISFGRIRRRNFHSPRIIEWLVNFSGIFDNLFSECRVSKFDDFARIILDALIKSPRKFVCKETEEDQTSSTECKNGKASRPQVRANRLIDTGFIIHSISRGDYASL